jgi:hypothetical protein
MERVLFKVGYRRHKPGDTAEVTEADASRLRCCGIVTTPPSHEKPRIVPLPKKAKPAPEAAS